jgi:hypothetical protein
MRYSLRALLIVLGLGPAVLAGWWLHLSRNSDPVSVIALIVFLVVGFAAAVPILHQLTRRKV